MTEIIDYIFWSIAFSLGMFSGVLLSTTWFRTKKVNPTCNKENNRENI